MSTHQRGYSSVVEHSTADREVNGSTPCAPIYFWGINVMNMNESIRIGFYYFFMDHIFFIQIFLHPRIEDY